MVSLPIMLLILAGLSTIPLPSFEIFTNRTTASLSISSLSCELLVLFFQAISLRKHCISIGVEYLQNTFTECDLAIARTCSLKNRHIFDSRVSGQAIAENLFQKPSLLHVVRNDYPYEFIPTLTMCLWRPLEFDLQVYIDYKSRNLYIKSIKATPFVTYSPQTYK